MNHLGVLINQMSSSTAYAAVLGSVPARLWALTKGRYGLADILA